MLCIYIQLIVMQGGLLRETGLLASLTAFSIALLAGMFLNRKQESEDERAGEEATILEMQEIEISKQLDSLHGLQAILSQKAQELDLEFIKNAPHILTVECLQQIFEFTASIIDGVEVENIYSNNRKARRSIFTSLKTKLGTGSTSDLEIYYRFVCTFKEQLQYLIEKAQKDFVIFLNIDYSTITDSIDFHMCQPEMDAWFKKWSEQINDQLRDKLPLCQHPIPTNLIFEIVQFQIQVLLEKQHQFQTAIQDLRLESEEEKEGITTFLQAFLEDLVFQKYGLEIEQLNLDPQDFTPDLTMELNILRERRNFVIELMMFGGHNDSQGLDNSEEMEVYDT